MARIPASAALKLMGDDPATMLLAIQLMDRMLWKRQARASGRHSSKSAARSAMVSGSRVKEARNQRALNTRNVSARAAKSCGERRES